MNQISDIINPRVQTVDDRKWVNRHVAPIARKLHWYDIVTIDKNWTCKECGSYEGYLGEKEWVCKECKDYHDYIIRAAPHYIDAMEYLSSLYKYHRDKVFTWEDYEKENNGKV